MAIRAKMLSSISTVALPVHPQPPDFASVGVISVIEGLVNPEDCGVIESRKGSVDWLPLWEMLLLPCYVKEKKEVASDTHIVLLWLTQWVSVGQAIFTAIVQACVCQRSLMLVGTMIKTGFVAINVRWILCAFSRDFVSTGAWCYLIPPLTKKRRCAINIY